MMTPERQRVNPFFTGGEVISVSYPTDTMEHADKLMSLSRGKGMCYKVRPFYAGCLFEGLLLICYMASRISAMIKKNGTDG